MEAIRNTPTEVGVLNQVINVNPIHLQIWRTGSKGNVKYSATTDLGNWQSSGKYKPLLYSQLLAIAKPRQIIEVLLSPIKI